MKRKSVLFLALILLLAGCGKSDSAKEQTGQAFASHSADTYDMEVAEETYEDAPADMAISNDSGAQIKESPSVENDLSARKLIRTISLSMETRAFDTLKSRLEETISAFGGYIEWSDLQSPQGENQYRSYSITARIPTDQLHAFMEKTGELGTITSQSENVEDVTLDYVDKTAYKESLEIEYKRVSELLEKAQDLDQVLALESKLSSLRYEINSYESQLRTYDNLIDYSTVNIQIYEVEYEAKAPDTIGRRIRNGLSRNLYAIRNFFVNLFVLLVSSLPILVLLAAALGILILLIKKLAKRSLRRRLHKTPDTKELPENPQAAQTDAPPMPTKKKDTIDK